MIYQDWGFSISPFQHTALPATEEGSKLLVGRDEEVAKLMRRIDDAPKIAVLEGLNGIGKTSLVNVAAYKLYERHLQSKGPLYLPCRKSFQLLPDGDTESFIDEVLLEVTQTLIDRKADLTKTNDGKHLDTLNKWLNSPEITSFQAGVWMIQGGRNVAANPNFERGGFRNHVVKMLGVLFPEPSSGGVICCIDNLELLQESDIARRKLEQLRDELLQIKGLTWVLCGALGITHGVMSSTRLDGYLHRPIEINEVNKSLAASILESRIHTYAVQETTYLPITQAAFDRLYAIVRGNLRTVLSYTGNYCQTAADAKLPFTDEEKDQCFDDWLLQEAGAAYKVARESLTPRTLEVFHIATKGTGIFSPSAYEDFGAASMPALRPYIKSLEDVSLLQSIKDDQDQRRKTIQVTAKGWLVDHYTKNNSPS